MYGYLGLKKDENFWMNITAITYRRDPWLMNQFTGATRGYVTAPVSSLFNETFSKMIPGLIEINQPVDTTGLCFVRIRKTAPGQGLKAGKRRGRDRAAVQGNGRGGRGRRRAELVRGRAGDRRPLHARHGDGNLRGPWHAAGSEFRRARQIQQTGHRCHPPVPEEGGPDVFPELNRTLLEELAPDAFDIAMANWGDVINGWARPV